MCTLMYYSCYHAGIHDGTPVSVDSGFILALVYRMKGILASVGVNRNFLMNENVGKLRLMVVAIQLNCH